MRKTNNTIDNRHSVSSAPTTKPLGTCGTYIVDGIVVYRALFAWIARLVGCPLRAILLKLAIRVRFARYGVWGLAQNLSDDVVVGLREGLCREQTNLALTSYLQGRFQLVRVLREKQCKTDNFTNAINKKILTQDTIHLKGE